MVALPPTTVHVPWASVSTHPEASCCSPVPIPASCWASQASSVASPVSFCPSCTAWRDPGPGSGCAGAVLDPPRVPALLSLLSPCQAEPELDLLGSCLVPLWSSSFPTTPQGNISTMNYLQVALKAIFITCKRYHQMTPTGFEKQLIYVMFYWFKHIFC